MVGASWRIPEFGTSVEGVSTSGINTGTAMICVAQPTGITCLGADPHFPKPEPQAVKAAGSHALKLSP